MPVKLSHSGNGWVQLKKSDDRPARLLNGHHCLSFPPNAEGCCFCSGDGMRARADFNRGDGCLVVASSLTERPG